MRGQRPTVHAIDMATPQRHFAISTRLEVARRLCLVALALAMVLFVGPVQCAQRVVTNLTTAYCCYFDVPLPMTLLSWTATVEPATFTKLPELRVSMYAGNSLAADVHGHRAFVSGSVSGGAIAVIDTVLNRVEMVLRMPSYARVAIDPVRARLYAASGSPQPQLAVLDTESLSFLAPINLPQGLPSGGELPLIVAPDGTRLFVAFGNVLLAVDLFDGRIVQSVTLDFAPELLALDQVRNELYLPYLYIAPGYFGDFSIRVLAADSLAAKRDLGLFDRVTAIAVRSADGALLLETVNGAELDAVDSVTGATLQTSPEWGYGLMTSSDGTEVYLFQRGPSAGASYDATSASLVILDAMSLNRKGSVALDARASDDPFRQTQAIIGTSMAVAPNVSLAVEYYDATLGHYFTTSIPAEISGLDGGVFPDWQRTGETLPVYAQRDDGPAGTTPVCRFYGLPEKGLDSHFYSASPAECAAVQQKWGDVWLLESSDVFHRYTTSLAIRDSMVQAGWIPEGYGPNAVAFCVPR